MAEDNERKGPPSQEDIAQLAYTLWLARGGEHGTPEQDWFRAEAALQR